MAIARRKALGKKLRNQINHTNAVFGWLTALILSAHCDGRYIHTHTCDTKLLLSTTDHNVPIYLLKFIIFFFNKYLFVKNNICHFYLLLRYLKIRLTAAVTNKTRLITKLAQCFIGKLCHLEWYVRGDRRVQGEGIFSAIFTVCVCVCVSDNNAKYETRDAFVHAKNSKSLMTEKRASKQSFARFVIPPTQEC